MLSYKEFCALQSITEQAEAMKGNCAFTGALAKMSKSMEKDYELKDTFNSFEGLSDDVLLYKHKNANTWVLGNFKECEEENKKEGFQKEIKFIVYFKIQFSNAKNYGFKINVKPLYNVDAVVVDETYRKAGIAKFMYKYFIKKEGYNILGDKQQFFGARRLWKKLSEDNDITVDIVDIKNGIYIEKAVVIKHGELDDEFDTRIWAEEGNTSTHNIRLVLKDIK